MSLSPTLPSFERVVTPAQGAAAGAVLWRSRGKLHVTVIAKATFVLVDGAEMSRVEPQEVLRTEVHHRNNPTRSVRYTADTAPYLPRADVLFTGFAFPPPGAPSRSFTVRLAVIGRSGAIMDKTLLIDGATEARVPLMYESALGGIGSPENPLGTDKPIVFDPARRDVPAGFGPIGRAWPARRKLLGALPRKALDAPIADLPDTFDWSYFQAAPADQRTELLRGDEWLLLEGLHPSIASLRTALPSARGKARVFGLPGIAHGQALDLCLDTVRIDGDTRRCTLVFRRSFPIPNEEALGTLLVQAGVESARDPIVWPAMPQKAVTLDLDDDDLNEVGDSVDLDGRVSIPVSAIAGARPTTIDWPGDGFAHETFALKGDHDGAPSPLPFRPSALPPAMPVAAPRAKPSFTGTLSIGDRDDAPVDPLPFRASSPDLTSELAESPLPPRPSPPPSPLPPLSIQDDETGPDSPRDAYRAVNAGRSNVGRDSASAGRSINFDASAIAAPPPPKAPPPPPSASPKPLWRVDPEPAAAAPVPAPAGAPVRPLPEPPKRRKLDIQSLVYGDKTRG